MTAFTLEDLQSIARDIIGDDELILSPGMTAAETPGWDSLNHTLISIEIGAMTGREVDAQLLGQSENFGDLVDAVNRTPHDLS